MHVVAVGYDFMSGVNGVKKSMPRPLGKPIGGTLSAPVINTNTSSTLVLAFPSENQYNICIVIRRLYHCMLRMLVSNLGQISTFQDLKHILKAVYMLCIWNHWNLFHKINIRNLVLKDRGF